MWTSLASHRREELHRLLARRNEQQPHGGIPVQGWGGVADTTSAGVEYGCCARHGSGLPALPIPEPTG